MIDNQELSITESSDFQYLLELMVPLYEDPAYAWLPELFSVIGYEKLILLCKFCGGSRIRIPTLDQLTESIQALDWYYKTHITREKRMPSVPPELIPKVQKIAEVIDARNNTKQD